MVHCRGEIFPHDLCKLSAAASAGWSFAHQTGNFIQISRGRPGTRMRIRVYTASCWSVRWLWRTDVHLKRWFPDTVLLVSTDRRIFSAAGLRQSSFLWIWILSPNLITRRVPGTRARTHVYTARCWTWPVQRPDVKTSPIRSPNSYRFPRYFFSRWGSNLLATQWNAIVPR